MSFKERRKQIYKIPTYLLIGIVSIFAIELGLSIINIVYPNPWLNVITAGILDSYKSVMNLVLGALIASLVGLFSSVAIMDLNEEKDRDNLISGFYFELEEINEKIQTIPIDNLNNVIRWLHVEKNPIYSDSGLFFIFRKEMFSLEQPLLEKMLSIYNKLIFIEQQWKNLQLEKPKLDSETPKIIEQLKNELNVFLPLLESERKKIQ
jgi:hypothetical protein